MGVGSAFNTALGGLDAFATMVGYISENLANAETPGYKRVDGNFLSYVTQSSATFNSPGGVTIQPYYRALLAGQVNSSDNSTSFAIANGEGFCPVSVPTVNNAGVAQFGNSQPLYTRACDFSLNSNGYLVNSGGDYLMGIQEQNTYQSNVPSTPSLGNLVGVRVDPAVYKSIPGIASTTINYNANFPGESNGTPTALGTVETSQVQVYDSLGGAHTMQIQYTKVAVAAGAPQPPAAPDATTSQWQVSSAEIVGVAQGAAGVGGAGPNLIIPTAALNPNSLYFTASGTLNGTAAITPNINLAIPWGSAATPSGAATPQNITMNYGTVRTATTAATGSTQDAGTNLDVRSVTDVTGQAPGTFQSATIDTSGNVVFSYSDGQQLKPFKIPLVTFNDPDKLQRVTGSVFAGDETLAGQPYAQWAGEGDAGKVVPNSVEESNVDIADELTQMIVAQRSYSSNGKVITTADQMIQEALQFVR